MQVQVTFRSDEIPAALRGYAETRLQVVEEYGEEFERSDVIVDVEHGQTVVEVILHRHRGEMVIGRAQDKESRIALDSAADKVLTQIVKAHKKRRNRS